MQWAAFKVSGILCGENVYFQAPNMAHLELTRRDNASSYVKVVCTGKRVYQFVPDQKQVRAYDLDPAKEGLQFGENSLSSLLSFLKGMKVSDAKARYEIRLDGEDANYCYLRVKPRDPDLFAFEDMQVALSTKTFLPQALRINQVNGSFSTWSFLAPLECDVPLDPKLFCSSANAAWI